MDRAVVQSGAMVAAGAVVTPITVGLPLKVNLLALYREPILYVDADCEFMARPELIDELVKSRRDFAIYNWFADEYTDGFVRTEPENVPSDAIVKLPLQVVVPPRVAVAVNPLSLALATE